MALLGRGVIEDGRHVGIFRKDTDSIKAKECDLMRPCLTICFLLTHFSTSLENENKTHKKQTKQT